MSDQGVDTSSLWMVPYADLMSTLVILFLALFAYAYGSRSPELERTLNRIEAEMSAREDASGAESRLRESELAVDLKRELDGLALKDFGVHVTSRYVHLTLPSPILFAEGSDRLSPEAQALLARVAGLFARLPNPVLVKGHTDDRPIVGGRHRTNWELSAARSFSVIEAFIGAGLPPSRFRAYGYGEHRPAASNATPEGRARNRRIEISLVREQREGEG